MTAKPWQNSSGCNDPTAYAATRPTEEEIQVSKLVKAIKAVAKLSVMRSSTGWSSGTGVREKLTGRRHNE